MTNLMTILERKAFISSNPRIVLSSCPPPCGHFSIQESATGGLSYKARDIPLTEDMLQIIENQKKFWGISKIINKNEYVFHQGDKRPISRDCVQSEIDRVIALIREDGINFERFTCHGFRHTFATRAIESGMQPQTLKTILGHSTLSMTMDLYSHVLPSTKAEEMEAISGAFKIS